MNFLIDANLPRRLVYLFRERGQQEISVMLNWKRFSLRISTNSLWG